MSGNTKIWDALHRRLKELGKSGAHVRVGVMGSGGRQSGDISMVELAAVHEFGTSDGRVPQRSFIRSTFTRERASVVKFVERIARGIISGKVEVEQGLGLLGLWAVAQVRKTITSQQTEGPEPQALKQSTIDRKGSSTPLVDTGQLINAISSQVEV